MSNLTNKLPTPKTLDEAITHVICFRPEGSLQDHAYAVMKDYAAQKFQIAMMKARDDEKTMKALEDLFADLTKRGIG